MIFPFEFFKAIVPISFGHTVNFTSIVYSDIK